MCKIIGNIRYHCYVWSLRRWNRKWNQRADRFDRLEDMR